MFYHWNIYSQLFHYNAAIHIPSYFAKEFIPNSKRHFCHCRMRQLFHPSITQHWPILFIQKYIIPKATEIHTVCFIIMIFCIRLPVQFTPEVNAQASCVLRRWHIVQEPFFLFTGKHPNWQHHPAALFNRLLFQKFMIMSTEQVPNFCSEPESPEDMRAFSKGRAESCGDSAPERTWQSHGPQSPAALQ